MSNMNLTNAEWNVMDCLWEKAPQAGREIVDTLHTRIGWSKSTTLTMLKRMTEKNLISCENSEKIRMYSPCINRDDAVKTETENFLNRVYKGSVSLMVSAMTQKQALSEEEIRELYEILEQSKTKPRP
ncbi:MAG: BlaI/MecI/CopY family transcriptional regulator [Lachnospiraceae bacterium]|nr:BlaI/MecI/CopY family transcriptional regulator [Lachnospiraceae bacterium]